MNTVNSKSKCVKVVSGTSYVYRKYKFSYNLDDYYLKEKQIRMCSFTHRDGCVHRSDIYWLKGVSIGMASIYLNLMKPAVYRYLWHADLLHQSKIGIKVAKVPIETTQLINSSNKHLSYNNDKVIVYSESHPVNVLSQFGTVIPRGLNSLESGMLSVIFNAHVSMICAQIQNNWQI